MWLLPYIYIYSFIVLFIFNCVLLPPFWVHSNLEYIKHLFSPSLFIDIHSTEFYFFSFKICYRGHSKLVHDNHQYSFLWLQALYFVNNLQFIWPAVDIKCFLSFTTNRTYVCMLMQLCWRQEGSGLVVVLFKVMSYNLSFYKKGFMISWWGQFS